jgi:hypothetical protein
MDRCNGTANYTSSQTALNLLSERCAYILSLPFQLSMWFVRNSAHVSRMACPSLTNSSKPMPVGFYSQHDPTTPAQVSIHHSHLAHILIFLIYSSIFRQTPYSSRVMVTLPSLDFYRKLSMTKKIISRSLNIHTLPRISYSRATKENTPNGFYTYHMK